MRLALLVHVAAAALLLCGCPDVEEGATGSGNTTQGSGATGGTGGSGQGGAGQGGAGQGGAGQGGAGQGGAGQGGAGQGGGGVSEECKKLDSELKVKLVDAQKCDPAIDIVQCVDTVSGLCCDEIVGQKDSPEVLAYLEAYEKWKAASCVASCPPVPCPAAPTGTCSLANGAGACVQNP
jgi:hypothetical protein